jgi:hypothetical protein
MESVEWEVEEEAGGRFVPSPFARLTEKNQVMKHKSC